MRESGRAAMNRPACTTLVGGAAVLHQREALQQVERARQLIVLLRIGDRDLLRSDMVLLLRLVDIGAGLHVGRRLVLLLLVAVLALRPGLAVALLVVDLRRLLLV